MPPSSLWPRDTSKTLPELSQDFGKTFHVVKAHKITTAISNWVCVYPNRFSRKSAHARRQTDSVPTATLRTRKSDSYCTYRKKKILRAILAQKQFLRQHRKEEVISVLLDF